MDAKIIAKLVKDPPNFGGKKPNLQNAGAVAMLAAIERKS